MASSKKLSWGVILFILLISHITVNTYVPSLIFNYAGILLVAMVAKIYVDYLNDEFQTLLLFFILSHFRFAASQGGLFNLVFFLVMLTSNHISVFSKLKNPFVPFVVLVIFSHFLGLVVKADAPLDAIIMGSSALMTYMAVFLMLSSSKITKQEFGQFIKVSSVLMLWMLLSQINSRQAVVTISSPLVSYSQVHTIAGMVLPSIMGSSPITAEYAFLHFVLGFGILAFVKDLQGFVINNRTLYFYVLCSIAVMVLTSNRSTVFVGTAAVAAILLRGSAVRSLGIAKLWVSVFVMALVLVQFGSFLGLDKLIDRLTLVELDTISIETIETGESINRSTAFDVGDAMLAREDWLVGYGWSTTRYNRIAWFGTDDFFRSDPHSLYLALPMLFGWIGAGAFLIIVVSPIIFGLHGILRRRYSNSNARSISWVFLLVSSLFMINEIKQGFITENYFLIIMFWIGIAVSIQRYGFRDDDIIDARR